MANPKWLVNQFIANYGLILSGMAYYDWAENFVMTASSFDLCRLAEGFSWTLLGAPAGPFNITPCATGLWTSKEGLSDEERPKYPGTTETIDGNVMCHETADVFVTLMGTIPCVFCVLLFACRIFALRKHAFSTVGYVVSANALSKQRWHKFFIYWLLFVTTALFIFALQEGLRGSARADIPFKFKTAYFSQFLVICFMVHGYHSIEKLYIPVGEAAHNLALPKMRWYQKPADILEVLEDGLLEYAAMKAKTGTGASGILADELGMSTADCDALFDSLQMDARASPKSSLSRHVVAKKQEEVELTK